MIGAQLQAAIYGALTAANVADGRIYDRVPPDYAFPYVTIGDSQVINDGGSDAPDDCQIGWEVVEDIHVWSRPVSGSKVEVKTLAAQIVKVLRGITAVSGHVVDGVRLDTSRTFRDPDGLTEHTVISMRFLISPAS